MSALLKFEVSTRWESCYSCGIQFGLTSDYESTLRRTKRTFYCPNGHGQCYTGKTEAETVREEMQAKLDRANEMVEWERAQAATADREAKKARAKLKAQTTRVEAGVCIHCNRTFKQLAAHMKCKHGEQV